MRKAQSEYQHLTWFAYFVPVCLVLYNTSPDKKNYPCIHPSIHKCNLLHFLNPPPPPPVKLITNASLTVTLLVLGDIDGDGKTDVLQRA